MRIAVHFEDSAISRKALQMAAAFAARDDGELLVVSTITREDPIRHSKLEKLEWEQEAAVSELLAGQAVNYACRLLVDSLEAGEQIVKFAKRRKVDWLYIGTPRKSKLAKLIMGSVSLFIILNAPCPVVTISETAAQLK